jgi:WD40 repeat protein/serine/threonine protein kinase
MVIGRFRLLEKIGEGGFGAVFVAEQKYPIKRRVALKIIKLGMDTKEVIARFEAERQALAMMDHPNIAKVYDAGATDTGRPYFAMELVRGIPITDYCDQNNLPPIERLKLFIDVCHAIQHAHQKGVIHRDIKPSNILVTLHDGVPVPKVIDFGIAKATQGDLTDKTVYTQFQQFIGTPAYMSPEQAEMSGLDIDTRSDIYSLGVLLYELLTGTTPFDAKELAKAGMDEMRRRIRETDPAKPSNRISGMLATDSSTTAKRRGMEPQRLISILRGDLDWIVMKCLEKDRTRRYETANGLAVDVRRYLNNEPIAARPPSAAYRIRKSIRRNKLMFAAGAAILLVLILGIAASSWQAIRATEAQKREAQQKQLAQANEAKALEAKSEEARARETAQLEYRLARQRAYASDMSVAFQALREGNLGRARDLLDLQIPPNDELDLRGWEWRYLWQQTQSDALSTLCKKTEIESISVSNDGRLLAFGLAHKDGVFVWDLQTRQQIAHLVEGRVNVRVAFSPTQPLLAMLGTDGDQARLTIWNSTTRQTQVESSQPGYSGQLVFSRDGETLLTSTTDATSGHLTRVRVSDGARLDTHQFVWPFLTRATTDLAANADLSIAACGTRLGKLILFDLANDKALWSYDSGHRYITALAFSPDGKTLACAAGFDDSDISLWDVDRGKELIPRLKGDPSGVRGHSNWVSSIVFWPDGKTLASSSSDQTIRTWDLATRTCTDTMRGHRAEVWRLALLPDLRTLASGAKDGEVALWDTSVSHLRKSEITIPEKLAAWQFSPDSKSIITLNLEGEIARWSGRDFQQKEVLLETNKRGRDAMQGGFSSDARIFVCGSFGGDLSVWDLSRRALVRSFKHVNGQIAPAAFIPGGSRLVLWTKDGDRVIDWDFVADREMSSEQVSASSYRGTFVSPDGRQLVNVDEEGLLDVHDLVAQTSARVPVDMQEMGSDGGYDPSGKWLAFASDLGYVKVLDTHSWREVATLTGFLNATTGAGFSPTGDRLATSASHGEEALKLWTTDGWHEVMNLSEPGDMWEGAAFSPDGNLIGMFQPNGFTLHLWQAPSWEQIAAARRPNANPSN